MNAALKFSHKILPIGVPLVIVLFLVYLTGTSSFSENPVEFSTAITFDLIITIPAIYLLLIWKREVPKITIVPVFLACVLLAGAILPKENQAILDVIKFWVLPIVELGALTYIFLLVRRTIVQFRVENNTDLDFYTALRKACGKIFPKQVVGAVAMEVAGFYYAFFAWSKRKLGPNEFSYHRESSTPAVLGVFVFLILLETVSVHLLIVNWSPVFAWVLSIISAYTAVQVFAILKSLNKRPISINKFGLHLKYGILADTEIPYENIQSIDSVSSGIEFNSSTRHVSPFKEIEGYNMYIELNKPLTISGFYGIKKSFESIAFHVDEKESFLAEVSNHLPK